MAFEFEVRRVKYEGREIAISGKLAAGAYAGPEAVSVLGQDGNWYSAIITSHEMKDPEDWPVLPSHRTVLTLTIPAPHPSFRLDTNKPIIGRGSLFQNFNRVDITHALGDPRFWAMWQGYHLVGDDVDEPHEQFWGISLQAINDYYKEVVAAPQEAGVWPYMRVPVGGSRYMEIEFAAAAEYPDRFWIGNSSTGGRVVLGYHSGHFSLPAFRLQEVLGICDPSSDQSARGAIGLMLMTGCYLDDAARWPADLVVQLAAKMPGVNPEAPPAIAHAMLNRLLIPTVRWDLNDRLGWVNNWQYSQRNPKSTMSVLTPEDFTFIHRFFSDQP